MIQETHIEKDLSRWNLNSPHLQRTAPQSPGVTWRMWGKLEIKNLAMENHGIYPDECNGNTIHKYSYCGSWNHTRKHMNSNMRYYYYYRIMDGRGHPNCLLRQPSLLLAKPERIQHLASSCCELGTDSLYLGIGMGPARLIVTSTDEHLHDVSWTWTEMERTTDIKCHQVLILQ